MNDFFFRLLTLLLIGSCLTLASCSVKEREMDEPLVAASEERRPPTRREVEDPQWERVDLKAVFFAYDKAVLKPAAKKVLKANAAWLKNHPDAHVQIEGRCDERGSDEYNLRLGEARANAAKTYLISLGIEAERISAVSYGEAPGASDSVRARNRNASPVIVYSK